MRAGIVVEEEAAGGIGAKAHTRCLAFRDEFGSRTRNRSEEPIEAAFSCDIFDAPGTGVFDEFVVAFGDAQDFIDGFNRFAGDVLFLGQYIETAPQGIAEPPGATEKIKRGLWGRFREGQELFRAFRGNDACGPEKSDEFFPAQTSRRAGGRERRKVGKIKGEAATKEGELEG